MSSTSLVLSVSSATPVLPTEISTLQSPKAVSIHAACNIEHCGFYEELAKQLPSLPRSITLAYLGNEKARAFPLCPASSPLSTTATVSTGWNKNQCAEEAVRDLLIEKMINITADATRRTSTYSKDMKILDQGFWYANDYFKYLSEKKQTQRIQYLKSKNSFYCGFPPKGFYSVPDSSFAGNSKPCSYQLKPGTSPAEGLANIRQKLCFIDCQEGIELAYYELLLEIWGETKFNQVFDSKGSSPLRFDPAITQTPLIRFISKKNLESIGKLGNRPVQPGDSVFFQHIPLYGVKHRQGEWGGFHVLCIQNKDDDNDDQKFAGFGSPPSGWTEKQILIHFADQFNQPPISEAAIYEKELIQTLSKQDKGLTMPLPPGMTYSEFLKIAQEYQLSHEQILGVNEENPTLAGFHPQVLSPNVNVIASILN
jgi:hypothetical protein